MAKIRVPDGDGPESARLMATAPGMAKGIAEFSGAVYANSKLPVRVREFARMRVAEINQCLV